MVAGVRGTGSSLRQNWKFKGAHHIGKNIRERSYGMIIFLNRVLFVFLMELNVICSPKFFYPGDFLIDIFSAITLFIIAFYSYKFYCHHQRSGGACDFRKLRCLSFGLLAFGFSFILKLALDSFIIIFDIAQSSSAAQHILVPFNTPSGMFIIAGYSLYKLFTFASLLLIYSVAFKQDSALSKLLISALLVLILLHGHGPMHYLFYLASCIILFIISVKYHQQYIENKNPVTSKISLSFGLLSLSFFMFMLAGLNPLVYIITKIVWLISFAILFFSVMKLMYYGKKKK
jgi:hypothetical protein